MLKICEVCNNPKLKKVLDLGRHPLCDDLVPLNSKKKNKFYKIQILFCPKCFTAHQKFQVKKKNTFSKKISLQSSIYKRCYQRYERSSK